MSSGTPPLLTPRLVTTSDYLTGARPVVGTLGACGLMLLACSWFVLGPGDLGKSRDVGFPAPVRIADARSEQSPTASAVRTPDLSAPRPGERATHAAAAKRTDPKLPPVTVRPRSTHVPAATNAHSPSVAPPTSAVPATTQPAAEPPAVTTPALPAPPAGLPEVPAPPVSLPQLPAVQPPAVIGTTTTQLGLP
jgi:hypothetical protein